MPKCKLCGESIDWIRDLNGKDHPIQKNWRSVWIYDKELKGYRLTRGNEDHHAFCKGLKKGGRK